MPFSKEIKENALIASARHCCVCHRYRGLKIEVHHIDQESEGGENSFDNAIALCFDCHTDAGHYNDNHPRGTKFSPNELRKARDEWYKIIHSNDINPAVGWSNDLHVRYIICKDKTDAFKIINGDLSAIPIQNSLLVENEIFKFFKWVEQVKNKFHAQWHDETNWFKDAFEYKAKYPDAIEVDRSDPKNPYFLCERIPSGAELLSDKFNVDGLNKLLIKAGVEPEIISKVYSYAEECGGGDDDRFYTESVRFRPLWFVFAVITNMSTDTIRLKNLQGSYNGTTSAFRPHEDSSGENAYQFEFPKASFKPGQSVIVPCALMFAPLENLNFEQTIISSNHSLPEVIKQFSTTSTLDSDKDKFHIVGPTIKPSLIMYQKADLINEVELHPFDLKRTYLLSSNWCIGSCPHLFYVTNNKILYFKELFARRPGRTNIEHFIIPKGIQKIVIAELESEETLIESLSVNNKVIHEGITLRKGDTLEVNVENRDSLKITGKYTAKFDQKNWELTQFRAELVGAFMNEFYCRLSHRPEIGSR